MSRRVVLRVWAAGTVGGEDLQALRDRLGLAPAGRASDPQDARFGYRRLDQRDASEAELSLWRHAEDRWSVKLACAGEPPPDDVVERCRMLAEAAARSVGLVVTGSRRW
jgi:hypothetical protein